MRKTRLVILPTKCLNQMGFLLLFLSCPVIGDWGRIRPDSEMSQWSILIEREGSCGLVRNPINAKNSISENLKECLAYNGKLMNGTLPTHTIIKNSIISNQTRTDTGALASETPTRRAITQRRINIERIRMVGERLRSKAEEKSARRRMISSVKDMKDMTGGRRDVLERRVIQAGNAYRNVGRLNRSVSPQRLLRRTYQEKSYRSVDNGRSENQRDRLNVQTRENRIQERNQDRSYLFSRRMTSALREKEGNEKEKSNFERTLRRIENVHSRRSTNEMKTRELLARSERRQPREAKWARRFTGNDRRVDDVENRKSTMYDRREMQNLKNDESVRRVNNQQRMSRRVASNNERIHVTERRYIEEERRIQNDERRLNYVRRSMAREREVIQNRRNENSSERSAHTKRNAETEEMRDTRAKNRIEISNSARQRRSTSRSYDQRMNQVEIGNRREFENTKNNRERNYGITTRLTVRDNDQVGRRIVTSRRQINKRSMRENDFPMRKERSFDNRQMSERRNELIHAQRTESNHMERIREKRTINVDALTKEKTRKSRDAERYLERRADQKERMTKMERMVQYDQLEALTPKVEIKMEKAEAPEQWEFLESTKSWIGLKNFQESRVIDYKDFTTTCLLGTAVFFLTTHPMKSI